MNGVERSQRLSLGQYSTNGRVIVSLRFGSQAHELLSLLLQKAIIGLVGPHLWRHIPKILATPSTLLFSRILSRIKSKDLEQERCSRRKPTFACLFLLSLYVSCRG